MNNEIFFVRPVDRKRRVLLYTLLLILNISPNCFDYSLLLVRRELLNRLRQFICHSINGSCHNIN